MLIDVACLLLIVFVVHKVVSIEEKLTKLGKEKPTFEELPIHLRGLLENGERLKAVKLYRKSEGVSLAAAEQEVDKLIHKLRNSDAT